VKRAESSGSILVVPPLKAPTLAPGWRERAGVLRSNAVPSRIEETSHLAAGAELASARRTRNKSSRMEEFRLSQDRGRDALKKEREMRRTGGYPAQGKLQSLGVFSEPSSCGVGTRDAPAEYDATWKIRTQGDIFCQSTTRRVGRQVLSDVEASVPGASYSPRKYFGYARDARPAWFCPRRGAALFPTRGTGGCPCATIAERSAASGAACLCVSRLKRYALLCAEPLRTKPRAATRRSGYSSRPRWRPPRR
jgi:hypothetical protein